MTARQAVHIPDDVRGTATPWGDLVRGACRTAVGRSPVLPVRQAVLRSQSSGYVRHRCDEAVYVVSGRVTITAGERRLAGLEPGSCVYMPRGLSRSFSTASAGARLLIIQLPAELTCQLTEAIRTPRATGRLGRAGGLE